MRASPKSAHFATTDSVDGNQPQLPSEPSALVKKETLHRITDDSTPSGKHHKRASHKPASAASSDGKLMKKQSSRRPSKSSVGGMTVSIDRTRLSSQQNLLVDSAMRATKRTAGGKKVGKKERRQDKEEMVVRLKRRKIPGPMGVRPGPTPPYSHADSFTMMSGPLPPPDPLTGTLSTATHWAYVSVCFSSSPTQQTSEEEKETTFSPRR